MSRSNHHRVKLFPLLAALTSATELAYPILWRHTSNPQGFTTGALWGRAGTAALLMAILFLEILARVAGLTTVLTLSAWPRRLLAAGLALIAGPYFLAGFWLLYRNSNLVR